MNRKYVYGCLGVLGLVAVAGLLFLYVNVLRPAQEIMADLRQLGELSELNARVAVTDPFVAPTDGALSADQLERFAAVQTAMRAALGPDYEELRLRAGDLRGMRRDEDGSFTKPGFRDVIRAFKGLGPYLERAKTAQINALNEAGFSYAEYRWVRETAYRALGQKNADVYLEEFAETVLRMDGEGDGAGATDPGTDREAPTGAPEGHGPADTPPADSAAMEPVVPITAAEAPRNRILAAAYADSLESWQPFLVFGL